MPTPPSISHCASAKILTRIEKKVKKFFYFLLILHLMRKPRVVFLSLMNTMHSLSPPVQDSPIKLNECAAFYFLALMPNDTMRAKKRLTINALAPPATRNFDCVLSNTPQ